MQKKVRNILILVIVLCGFSIGQVGAKETLDYSVADGMLIKIKNSLKLIKEEYDFPACLTQTAIPEKVLNFLVGATTIVGKVEIQSPNISSKIEYICIPTVEYNLKVVEGYKNRYQELIASNSLKDLNLVKEVDELLISTSDYFNQEKSNLENMANAIRNGYSFSEAWNYYYGDIVTPPIKEPIEIMSTCNLLGNEFGKMVKWVIDFIQISIPILIIIMTISNFTGVVFSGEEKNFKAAGAKLVKRLIIGVAIILLPMLITFIIDFSGVLEPYGIEKNQLFCSLF